jgi:glycosyltransferase involved in cell wall biosynthesis
MPPLISVIIPVHNGDRDLPALLDCLRSQTLLPEQVEYLIVNNQSSDRTYDILEDAAKTNPQIIPLQATKIQSAYAARNVGIKASRGELLVFTDADCRPQPDWLEHLISPFAQPEINLVVGEILGLAGDNWLEVYADLAQTLSQQHTLNHEYLPYGQTANLAIRKSALKNTGLFRPCLTTGGDADLCWRVQIQFPDCLVFAPRAIVHHRHRSSLREFYRQWHKYGSSNRYLHQLHGVDLMRSFTLREYLYRLLRWLFRELPPKLITQKLGTNLAATIFATPLGLWGTWARLRGQNSCEILPQMWEIEWMEGGRGGTGR